MSSKPAKKTVRVDLHLPTEVYERVKFWAEEAGISANEYLREAVQMKLDYELGNYPMSNLMVARMGEVIDLMGALLAAVGNSTEVTANMGDSLLSMARGDNEYLTDESGELTQSE